MYNELYMIVESKIFEKLSCCKNQEKIFAETFILH